MYTFHYSLNFHVWIHDYHRAIVKLADRYCQNWKLIIYYSHLCKLIIPLMNDARLLFFTWLSCLFIFLFLLFLEKYLNIEIILIFFFQFFPIQAVLGWSFYWVSFNFLSFLEEHHFLLHPYCILFSGVSEIPPCCLNLVWFRYSRIPLEWNEM